VASSARDSEPARSGVEPARESETIRQRVAAVRAERIWTLPNALSALRLAGVPLFLWLLLGPHADGYAVLVLAVAGVTDWLDGKTARWLDQYSRLGELLDPAADRLYILATLAAFLIRRCVSRCCAEGATGRSR
jgi:cardiolipin synthase